MPSLALALRAACVALRRLHRDQRGQAMVEYSTITFAILIGFGLVVVTLPVNGVSLAEALYRALQTYVDSVNFSLSLAAT